MAIQTNLDSDKIAPIVEEFQLPSCGLLYDGKLGPTVKIHPYSFDTERYLMTNLKGNEKMARVAAVCLKLGKDGLQPDALLMHDVFTILAIARGLTYGEQYSFRSECPECDFKETHQVKVPKDLPVKTWSEYATKEELEKAMEFTLPHGGDKIAIRHFTMKDENDLESTANQIAAASRSDLDEERYMTRLAMHLVSVNGGVPENHTEARKYIKRLEGPNMVAYEEGIGNKRCGIVFAWQVLCGGEGCTHRYEALVPMAGNFFRGD